MASRSERKDKARDRLVTMRERQNVPGQKINPSQCNQCVHYNGDKTCKAFEKGIPPVILKNLYDHRKRFKHEDFLWEQKAEYHGELNPFDNQEQMRKLRKRYK